MHTNNIFNSGHVMKYLTVWHCLLYSAHLFKVSALDLFLKRSLCSCCRGRGQAAVESLASEGLKPMFHQLDINDLNSITAAAAYFKEKYGGVDVLVNNAAIAFKGRT